MKWSYGFSLIIALLFWTEMYGQWYIQSCPTDKNLRSVYFVSATAGIAVGDDGTIIRTYNGGINWDSITSVTNKDLRSVYFPSSTIGYAVGVDGVMLKSLNAGLGWIVLDTITTEILHSVWFYDNDTGYVAGNNTTIYKTTDGGNTWISANNGTQPGQDILDMYWFNKDKGFAAISQAGAHGILKTTNGGANWSKYVIGSNIPKCIHFTNVLKGHAAGSSSHIWRTGNGGNTWFAVDSSNVPPYYDYYGIYFSNTYVGYIVANNGNIMKTIDGGISYSLNNTVTTKHLMDVYFPVDGIGYIVGYDGIILKMGGGAGIDDETTAQGLKFNMYPNPADDYINVEINEKEIELSIFDVEGRLLLSKKLKLGINRINIGQLNPGLYFVHCESEKILKFSKLIKK